MIAMADRVSGVDLAQHPIDTAPPGSQECSYSPDGRWICFSAGARGATSLFVMHADGSHVVQLTDPNDVDGQPAFSPDQKTLVYRTQRGTGGHSQIFIADLVYNHESEITGVTNERGLTSEDNLNINPAWHPDGRHIIYATSRHGVDNYELYLMDIWGRHKTRITFFAGADLLPTFSTDGKYLMWTSKRSKDGTDEVFVARFQFPRGS